jgi:hypothetical protein
MPFNEIIIDKDIERYINKMKSQEGYILADELKSNPFADIAAVKMLQFELIELNTDKKWMYVLTPKGWAFESIEKLILEQRAVSQKIIHDAKISKRIYKSYCLTQFITWTSFAMAVLLGWLKLAEVLKLWPYHK